MEGKVPILIQGFVRTMDEPLLEFAVLRDMVALCKEAPKMLQVIQVYMPADRVDPFKKDVFARLAHFHKQAHIAVVEREGVHLWVVGTGDVREQHADLVDRCLVMPYPYALDDPIEISP